MFAGRTPLLAFLLVAAPHLLAAQDSSTSKARRIDVLVARYEKLGYLNGAILVADHGQVIYERGVGYANISSQTPNTPRTRFDIASITKQFAGVLVLQQAAQGRISLQAHVSDYLPWYRKDTGNRITIEQLLHHTSGLPGDFDSSEFNATAAAAVHYEPEEFSRKFCQSALISEPGAKWHYSNCGYNLLGLVLEHVTGISFDDLLHKQLLEPLTMKDSGMDHNDLAQLGGATGYVRHAGPWYSPGPPLDRVHFSSAGGMYSMVEDLYKWNQALSNEGLLSKDLREQIFAPGLNNWGYGWFVTKIPAGQPEAGNTLAEMRGDLPENFFAWTLRYPERDGVIIVLRNVYGSTEGFEQNIQAILFDAEPRLPSRSAKDIAAQIWLVPARFISTHPAVGAALVLLIGTTIWQLSRRRRRV